MPVLAALVFCRLPSYYAWYIKLLPVFCLTLAAKINFYFQRCFEEIANG
jgi:hypothetical protein